VGYEDWDDDYRSEARRLGDRRAHRQSDRLVAHVDSVLGNIVSAIGSVEGRLEGLNVHGSNRYFNVYDDLTGERVQCQFGHRIDVAKIGGAVERRVSVSGEIRYRETGEIVNVIAHSLDVFPQESDLPSADDVYGIIGR
jgi:hypothetical protein